MTEVWKPVVGFEGLYEVSDLGAVRSLRFANNKIDKLRDTPKHLKPKTVRGYRRVSLRKDGRTYDPPIHRIVLRAFSGEPPARYQAAQLEAHPMTESELVTELRAEIERRRLLANEDHETIATQAAEVERLRGEASQRDEMLAGAIRDYNALKEGFAPLQTILDMTEAATCEQVVSQAKLLVATKIRLRGESSAAEARATTAESSLETARGALEKAYWIAFNGNGSDAADCAVNIAKQIRALAALPSPPITIIKGEG